jgi:erythritol kinase (D-erythritol 1-phosphate-forming)
MGLGNDVLIGLDAGASRVQAVAFAPDGEELGCATAVAEVHHVADGGIEQDLGAAWQAAAAALRGLAGGVPDLAARTVALAITGPGGGAWLIDEDGDPAGRAWLPADRRAAPLVERWRRLETGRRLPEITGSAVAPTLSSAQLAWMAERCPGLLDQAATAFQGKDWLYYCCTRERATDPASAAAAFGDFRTGAYDPRVLELLRLPELARLLPQVVDGTREHAELTVAAAAATGLIAGTPVVLGPVDLIATALAAGLAPPDAGLGCTILGGGGIHIRADLEPPKLAQGSSAIAAVLPFAKIWFKVAHGPARVVAEWLVDLAAQLLADAGLIGVGRAELIAILEQKAAAAPPATLQLQPGARETDHARAPAGFLGVSGATTLYDLLRSIYEGQGHAARACYGALGGKLEEIRVTGDGAASPLARQVLAACVDAPVRVLRRDAPAAAGAALITAVALGHYRDLAAASRDWVGRHLLDPEPVDRGLRSVYAERLADAPSFSRDRRAGGA